MYSIRTLALVLLTCVSGLVHAQNEAQIWSSTDNLFRAPAAENDASRPLGWQFPSIINANLSLTTSQDVVGQTSGTSETYGINYHGSLHHFTTHDEWRNDLFAREATTKTASLGRFVKSEDELKLSTIYLYYVPNHPSFGPYSRAEVAAPIFKGEDAEGSTKRYRIDKTNEVFDAATLRLTDGFRPLTTKEAVGAFYRPFDNPRIRVETRLGFAALQIQAEGQFARKGAEANGEILVQRLRDVSQAGMEAAVSVRGSIDDKTGYELGVDSLTPFINDRRSSDTRSAWRLTNVDGYVKLTSKVTTWMSFGYDYKLKIQPQLVDTAQQIHMITLNLSYPVSPGRL